MDKQKDIFEGMADVIEDAIYTFCMEQNIDFKFIPFNKWEFAIYCESYIRDNLEFKRKIYKEILEGNSQDKSDNMQLIPQGAIGQVITSTAVESTLKKAKRVPDTSSTKNEVNSQQEKSKLTQEDFLDNADIHSQNKELLDKDYAKDKLNATESK